MTETPNAGTVRRSRALWLWVAVALAALVVSVGSALLVAALQGPHADKAELCSIKWTAGSTGYAACMGE